MIRRVRSLSGYLSRSLAFSLTGLILLLATLVFWRLFFDPTQGTPEPSYYILLTTLFGAGMTFFATLFFAGRANRAVSYPFLARLPSRVEYLTAVFVVSVLYAFLLQLILGLLATWRGPELTLERVIEIPPLWISVNILASVMALHASDLVARGWSRVYVYGSLALLLFANSLSAGGFTWLTSTANSLSAFFFGRQIAFLGTAFNNLANWLATGGAGILVQLTSTIFWPFQAINDAVVTGHFTTIQALAPAILLLYATALFMLAAEFFSGKDLFLAE